MVISKTLWISETSLCYSFLYCRRLSMNLQVLDETCLYVSRVFWNTLYVFGNNKDGFEWGQLVRNWGAALLAIDDSCVHWKHLWVYGVRMSTCQAFTSVQKWSTRRHKIWFLNEGMIYTIYSRLCSTISQNMGSGVHWLQCSLVVLGNCKIKFLLSFWVFLTNSKPNSTGGLPFER